VSEEKIVEKDTLRVQLAELNNRGRQYGAQSWQVPFAYVGILGVVLAQVADKGTCVIRIASICGGLFGSLVLLHLLGMADGSKRAVKAIRDVEKKLYLTPTADFPAVKYVGPLVGIVGFAIAGCVVLLVALFFA